MLGLPARLKLSWLGCSDLEFGLELDDAFRARSWIGGGRVLGTWNGVRYVPSGRIVGNLLEIKGVFPALLYLDTCSYSPLKSCESWEHAYDLLLLIVSVSIP